VLVEIDPIDKHQAVENLERIVENLDALVQILSNGVAADRSKAIAPGSLHGQRDDPRIAGAVEQYLHAREELASESTRESFRSAARVLEEVSQGEPVWMTLPEAPHRERGTPRKNQPTPLYYVLADTGYRIAAKGMRSLEGWRSGR
jgi:hypothetical protein